MRQRSAAVCYLALAAALLSAVVSASSVTTFSAKQFALMTGGSEIPGLSTAAEGAAPLQPHTMWVVRFALPWESSAANDTAGAIAFNAAARVVPTAVARFAEVVVATPLELAVVDALGVDLPHVRAYHSKVVRPDVPRGNQVSGRAVANVAPVAKDNLNSADALVRYTFESVPPTYVDFTTDAIYPAVRTISGEGEAGLTKSVKEITEKLRHVAAASDAVAAAARDGTVRHALVLVHNLRAKEAHDVVAAATATGAALHGRGGTAVFVSDSRAFPEWAPEDEAAGAFVLPIGFNNKKGTLNTAGVAAARKGLHGPDAVAAAIDGLASSVETASAFVAAKAKQIADAKAGAALYTTPVKEAKDAPVRRIDTTAQFHKHVTELKMGAAVIFFVRESDMFYAKALRIAREVAHSAMTDPSAVINEKRTAFHYEVFLVDAEVHKDAARELRVPQVPSVGFLLELKDKTGVKGLRYFKEAKFNFEKAAPIIKFMRSELFNGRDMIGIDPNDVKFAETLPPSPLDNVALQTSYFDINPRRFDTNAPDEHGPEYKRALAGIVARTGATVSETPATKPGKKGKKVKPETPEEKAKREKREAKQREADEKRKEKIKQELEAKVAAKKAKMAAKQQQEDEVAKKRKAEIEAKAQELRERKAREEADGTAARRRAAAKAKKARIERLAKLRKAKLAAKTPKDRATMVRLWADDSREAAKLFTVVADDGRVSVLDRLL